MKTVSELLNLLLSNPSDAAGLLKEKTGVSPKGPQGGDATFENVLSRLFAQAGEGNASNAKAPALQPASETHSQIGPNPNNSNFGQMAQAEQTLSSLSAGLTQLIHLMSQLQHAGSDVNPVSQVSGGGKITLSDAQNVLDSLQPLLQKLSSDQNPLLLPADQQDRLMSQVLQQMLQNQQILLGGVTVNPAGNTTGAQKDAGAASQAAVLQVLFPETRVEGIQSTQTQASQVLINLQNFKMSATFLQAGTNPLPVSGGGAALVPAQPLTGAQSVNSAFSAAVSQTPSNVSAQNDLNQNFKNLVQLLMQSGVSQAVLTSFMRNHQGSADSLTAAANPQNAPIALSSNSLTKALPETVEIAPVNPASLSSGSANNANVVRSEPKALSQAFSAAGSQPVENARLNPQEIASLNDLVARLNAFASSVNADVTSAVPNPGNNPGNTINSAQASQGRNTSELLQVAANGENVKLNSREVTALNDLVARLNAFAARVNATVPPATQTPAGQLSLNNPTANIPIPAATETAQGQNQPNLGQEQAQPQNTLQKGIPENPALNPQVQADLNNVQTRINTSALHLIQGSIGGENTAVSADLRYTMGQIQSALTATQPSSPTPPTFGNPSVPMNAPVPPAQTLTPGNGAHLQVAALSTQVQTNQNIIPLVAGTSNTVTKPSGEAGLSLSTPLLQPINQTAQPALPAPGNVPLANNPLNPSLANGVVTASLTSNSRTVVTPPVTITPPNPTGTIATGPTPTPVPTSINPLPTPVTLPAVVNPPLTVGNNAPGTIQGFAPVSLNQNLVPPATSAAPIVPTTVVVGEGLKTEAPPAAVIRNENLTFQSTVAATQPLSSVIPVSPEAVTPAGGLLGSPADLATLNATDKNPNNLGVLEANSLLGISNLANQIPDKVHSTNPPFLGIPGVNFDTASLLNQISQQVASQTAQTTAISHLNFQLVPENLGRMTIQLALVDQSVSARIVVTNPEVRDNLQNHMVDLKTALNHAGLQIDQLQVQVQGGGSNLLAQYYQYQQEGSGYRLPASPMAEGPENPENTGILEVAPPSTALVDMLA